MLLHFIATHTHTGAGKSFDKVEKFFTNVVKSFQSEWKDIPLQTYVSKPSIKLNWIKFEFKIV